MALAHRVAADIPFLYMHLPWQWWRHFNSTDGSLFGQKRGKNFLGLQSRLNEFYLATVEDAGDLCGVVPVVSYIVKLQDEETEYRILAFAGDYISATCQDFLVLPENRSEILQSILSGLINLLGPEHDLLYFGNIPEFSENIPCIRQILARNKPNTISHLEMTTARRGGVWPWTLAPLSKSCKSMLNKIDGTHLAYQDIQSLSRKLEQCTPFSLLFPKNRTALMEDLASITLQASADKKLKQEIESINYCLNPAAITYPYINLPPDRETYWQSLSKSKRYYYHRYLKRFQEAGGKFEKIGADSVTLEDINDCIRLHLLRWGKDSAVVCGAADAFQRDVSMAMAKEDMFTIFFATLNGERIAAHTCFDIDRRREFYLPGRHPAYDITRAGALLALETILEAIDHGFKVYDLGVIAFPYKLDFTRNVYTARNFFIYTNGSQPDLNKIFHLFEYMHEEFPADT